VVDVFTDTPLEGNPAAVVTDAHGIPTGRMQRNHDLCRHCSVRQLHQLQLVF
jgi:hypothetical protein